MESNEKKYIYTLELGVMGREEKFTTSGNDNGNGFELERECSTPIGNGFATNSEAEKVTRNYYSTATGNGARVAAADATITGHTIFFSPEMCMVKN